MNNDFNIEYLRKTIRSLQEENEQLKSVLKKANIPFCLENKIKRDETYYDDEYDLDQAGRINEIEINEKIANEFYSLFWGRTDVYAKRSTKGGYFPQCKNRWNSLCTIYRKERKRCPKDCEHKVWQPLTLNKIVEHLKGLKDDGSDVIGIYPLLKDNTCRFLVFDFDNHDENNKNKEWINEINTLRKICNDNNISCLVERSRSGNGGHLWILFKEPIKANIARNFGFLLLNKGLKTANLTNFKYYDRMYPSQDESKELGSLVALPLQGKAVREGNSVFVDENFNAYENQWGLLANAKRYNEEEIVSFIHSWQIEASMNGEKDYTNEYIKPWRRNNRFDKKDVIGKMYITLSNGIYIDSINILNGLKNQIRSLAAFDNPVFYKNKNLGISNYRNYSAIYLGEDVDGYIHLPRGIKDKLLELLKEANIDYLINDERITAKYLNIDFNGDLKEEQLIAANEILNYQDGILEATTAFGKTVVASYLIAKRRVSTLILIQNSSLLNQWISELNRFLKIDESLPMYKTKTGKDRIRKSLIGELHGSKNTLTGIVDVVMIGSLANKENIDEIVNNYGMVIFDECHHAASSTAIEILKRIKSKYVYGVSATPYRSDRLEKINYMYLGPVRITYSTKQRIKKQKIGHYIIPRYTRMVDNTESRESINAAYDLIISNKVRNEMIINDVISCVDKNRTPLVLTKQKNHAKYLYEKIKNEFENVFLIYGDQSEKENSKIINEIKALDKEINFVLVATGQKIGEGFDLPRLDTLMLVSPISFEGRVEQYLGRVNRDFEDKEEVIVYDYIDSHMRYFKYMYYKRLKQYKKIGYLIKSCFEEKQIYNTIFDSFNYQEVLEKDLLSANKEVIISSPSISYQKIDWFIATVKNIQEKGVVIMVITTIPEKSIFDDSDLYELIYQLRSVGIDVILKKEVLECFGIIDDEIVWHGGMNLLGKADAYDNLMRVISSESAAELKEIELGNEEQNNNEAQ